MILGGGRYDTLSVVVARDPKKNIHATGYDCSHLRFALGVERLLDLVVDHSKYHKQKNKALMACLTKDGRAATWKDIKARDALLTRYPHIELLGCKYSAFADVLSKLSRLPEQE